MKLQEMRVGNYYHWEAEGKKYLFQIEPRDFAEDNYLNFEEVPLTEEFLLDFRFDDLGDYGYGMGNFHICLHSNEFYIPINNKKIFIQYVHQLQNIFHSLTGEELILQNK